MKASMLAVAFLLLAACAAPDATPSASVDGSAVPATQSAASSAATATPVVEPPTWPPEPNHDEQFVPVGRLALHEEGRLIGLEFTGARAFSPGNPCSADYSAATAVVDGVLEVGVFQSRPPRPAEPPPCDSIGFGRYLEVALAESFTGAAWRDRYGPYLHFLAPPEVLVQLAGLPAGWKLRAGRDVEDSPWGRWERTYSPDDSPSDPTRTVVLYQSFGGPVNVTGGNEEPPVEVNGMAAALYRWPLTGELVLVWRLGDNGLALVAYEREFSIEQVIALAESAKP